MALRFEAGASSRGGRRPPPQREPMTPHEARAEAARLLREQRVYGKLERTLALLATNGVLTDGQLDRLVGVSDKTLRRYYKRHLLDRPRAPEALGELGVGRCVYTLGLVGQAIAGYQHEQLPSGYIGYGSGRILHDLLVGEVMLHLVRAVQEREGVPVWSSKLEATVRDSAGAPELEPDALLVAEQPHGLARFVLEYHNEDWGGRAEEKVVRYERAYRNGQWQLAWQTEEMPAVLVAWTHRAVGVGYQEALARHAAGGLRCTYLGKALRHILAGEAPTLWRDLLTGEPVDILAAKPVVAR